MSPDNPAVADVITLCGSTIREAIKAGQKIVVKIDEPKRNDESNALMWVLLGDMAKQVGWNRSRWRGDTCLSNGSYVLLADYPDAARLSNEDFKDIITAGISKPRLAAGQDGGIVALGLRTSKMSQRQIGEVIDAAQAWGSSLGVEWSPNPNERTT